MGLLNTTRLRTTLAAAVVAVVFCALPASAGAETVVGNPGCADLNPGWTELKVEPVAEGTYSDGTLTVTISDIHDSTFDWTASQGVDAVIVKGGPPSNIYRYDPEATSDSDLAAPSSGDGLYGLSHIAFCYDTEPPPPGPCTDTDGDGHDDDGVDNGNDGVDDCAPPIVCLDEDGDGMDDDGQDGNYDGVDDCESPPPPPGPCVDMDGDGDDDDGVDGGNDGVDDCGGGSTSPPPPPPPPPPADTTTSGDAPADGSAPAGGSAPSDVGGVLGETAVSGTARLSAPSGCVGNAFTVRVRGRSIRSVRFTVDGRRVRTTRKGSVYSARINTRGMRAGAHRLVARVTFTRASRTGTRTLRRSFLRCSRTAVAPRFTG